MSSMRSLLPAHQDRTIRMSRARPDITEMQQDIIQAVKVIRQSVDLTKPENDDAMAQIETFCAIALRVFAKTNPSKLRDAAITEEIKARMEGREVIE